jgi:hypothetical protein
MAKKIKTTPKLKGKEAKKFIQKLKENKPIDQDKLKEDINIFLGAMKNFNNRSNYV